MVAPVRRTLPPRDASPWKNGVKFLAILLVVPALLSPSLLDWSWDDYWEVAGLLYGVELVVAFTLFLSFGIVVGSIREALRLVLPVWLIFPLPILLMTSLLHWPMRTYLRVSGGWCLVVLVIGAAALASKLYKRHRALRELDRIYQRELREWRARDGAAQL
jgi:hypothetical protein